MTNKERFIDICRSNIKREGLEDLLQWLETSDFYVAPASTKYHGNFEGGLLEHSLNVYDNLIKVVNQMYPDNEPFTLETLTIASLFHDLCKVNFYQKGYRNVKDAMTNQWVQKQIYEINEKMPLGHGEKSCMLILTYMKLTADELLSIRWHMGGFDSATRGGEHGMATAQGYTPLVTLLQVADMLSTLQEETVE